MIDNDDIDARVCRTGKLIEGGDAAVDGYDHTGARVLHLQQRWQIRPVSFAQPIRNVDIDVATDSQNESFQQCRRGRTIHIVVAKNANRLSPNNGTGKTIRSFIHSLQKRGIRQQ